MKCTVGNVLNCSVTENYCLQKKQLWNYEKCMKNA